MGMLGLSGVSKARKGILKAEAGKYVFTFASKLFWCELWVGVTNVEGC